MVPQAPFGDLAAANEHWVKPVLAAARLRRSRSSA
jgi:hypothetical protein